MRWLLAMMSLVAAGCRCGDRLQQFRGEGRFTSAPAVRLLDDGEAKVDFGAVAFGDTKEVDVELQNIGSGRLGLEAGELPDVPFELAGALPVSVEAGDTQHFKVRFAPPLGDEEFTTVSYENRAVLVADERSSPERMVLRLEGTGVIGVDCVALVPSPVDFGAAPLACSVTREVAVTNRCDESIRIAAVTTVPTQTFTTAIEIPAEGVEVPAGGRLMIPVRFRASELGEYTATLRVLFSRGGRALTTRRATMAAVSEVRARQTEAFEVQRAIDVLTMMYDRGSAIDAGWVGVVDALLAGFEDAGVDYHLGFSRITQDWDADCQRSPTCRATIGSYRTGELVAPDGGPAFISPATPDKVRVAREAFDASLFRTFPLGQDGPICFEAARQALLPAVASTTNAGFAREGIHLAVLCFSFSGDVSSTVRYDDYGWAHWPPSAFYADALAAAKRSPELISVSSATGLPTSPECQRGTSVDSRARYVELASLTGGVVIDACAPDWQQLFQHLNERSKSSARTFLLAGGVDPAFPMSVEVGGQTLAPDAWSFRLDGGALSLADLPPLGTSIRVTYTPRCP